MSSIIHLTPGRTYGANFPDFMFYKQVAPLGHGVLVIYTALNKMQTRPTLKFGF